MGWFPSRHFKIAKVGALFMLKETTLIDEDSDDKHRLCCTTGNYYSLQFIDETKQFYLNMASRMVSFCGAGQIRHFQRVFYCDLRFYSSCTLGRDLNRGWSCADGQRPSDTLYYTLLRRFPQSAAVDPHATPSVTRSSPVPHAHAHSM